MGRSRSQASRLPWPGLVAAAITLLLSVTLTLAPARKAMAQAGDTHIVLSETIYDLDGTDRAREYIEFANLGTKDWDPRGCWIYRRAIQEDTAADDDSTREPRIEPLVMIQIAGDGAKDLKPIPPGGVLWVEWGRPNPDNGDYPTASGANVFRTGRSNPAFQDNDLHDKMSIALFGPQTAAPAFPTDDPTFGGATMLAYYIQGNDDEATGTAATLGDNIGLHRAIDLGLWEDYRGVPSGYDWCSALRWPAPAPGHPIPANIGRRASDYYLTLYGLPDLSIATSSLSATNSDQTTPNLRKGTPGQPNYQFGVPPIAGQTLDNGNSMQFLQVAASASSTPSGAIQIAAVDTGGAIATNILTGDTWSGWQFVGGPALSKPVLVQNSKSASNLLVAVDAISGQLYVNRFAASGSNPAAFGAWQAVGGKATGAPAATADPATGVEIIVFNDQSGQTMVLASQDGKFGPSQPLPGNAKLTDLATAFTANGLVVLGFEGGQLRMSVGGPSGTFSDLVNAGPALTSRAQVALVAKFNEVAGQVEIVTAGQDGALELRRLKLGSTRSGDTVTGPIAAGISTDSAPGIGINTDTGDVLVIARGADHPIPDGERLNPQRGYARTATFRNSSGKFDPPGQVANGQMPRGASPDAAYNPNTKQMESFVVGDDNYVYRVTTK